MSLTDLIPSLQSLPRPDKLRAIQYLAAELAREDDVASLLAGQTCEVWSPYDADEAAAVLLDMRK